MTVGVTRTRVACRVCGETFSARHAEVPWHMLWPTVWESLTGRYAPRRCPGSPE